MVLGDQQREPTCHYLVTQLGEMDLAHGYYLTILAGGKKALSCSCNSPANEKPLYFELPVNHDGSFIGNSLPNLKECSSPVLQIWQ